VNQSPDHDREIHVRPVRYYYCYNNYLRNSSPGWLSCDLHVHVAVAHHCCSSSPAYLTIPAYLHGAFQPVCRNVTAELHAQTMP